MITMIVPAAILAKDGIIQAHGSVEPFGADHLICRFASKADAEQFRGSFSDTTNQATVVEHAKTRASDSADASISATATRAESATTAAAPRSSSCGTSICYATATSDANVGRMAHITLDGDKLTGTLTGDAINSDALCFRWGKQWHGMPYAQSYSITIPASHAPLAMIQTIARLAKVSFASEPRLVEGDKMFCVIKTQAEVIRFLGLVSA